jgi:hypothetical protein
VVCAKAVDEMDPVPKATMHMAYDSRRFIISPFCGWLVRERSEKNPEAGFVRE